jgi:ubiquinone/menaquinone biosynthesis C-methylase UbiE
MNDAPSPLATPLPWDLVATDYAVEVVPLFEHYAADALRLAAHGTSARVLDVACGPGTLSLLAARSAKRVDAIDFSPTMVARFRARLAEARLDNVEVREGDGQALPFDDRSFDAAFSMFGLMFFPDRGKGFSEVRRVLVPGGVAVVSSWLPFDSVPLLTRLFSLLAEKLPDLPFGKSRAPLGDADEMQREMEAAGFRDVRVERHGHFLEAPSMQAYWDSMQRTMAPLALLRKKLGAEAWPQLSASMLKSLLDEFGPGAVRFEMAAWLGRGVA